MRLVCPNCSAQYEVDGSMIPDDGRDVQCSNCGHTWFELPGPREAVGDADAAGDVFAADDGDDAFADARGEAVEDEIATDSEPSGATIPDDDGYEEIEEPAQTSRRETRPENLSREVFENDDDFSASDFDEPEAETEAASSEEAPERDKTSEAIRALTSAAASIKDTDDKDSDADAGDADGDADADRSEADADAAAAGPRRRRPADAAALDILREEAEREMSQRRAQPSENIETQPDLGLEEIRNRKTPSRALRARMAHLGEEMPEERDTDEAPEEEAPSPHKTRLISQPADLDDGYEEPRRDLLPDIEEINSTLRTSARGPEAAEASRRSGFRIGFLLVLFVTVAAIFTYSQAPAIARALPESEPTLTAFLDWTNGMRDRLDGLIGQ